MLDWMKHKLESRLLGEISITLYSDDTSLRGERKEKPKSLLIESEKGE